MCRATVFCPLALLLALPSCGGDGDGLSAGDVLSDLDEGERGVLCERLIEGFREQVDVTAICTVGAVIASLEQPDPDPTECRLFVILCARQLSETTLDPEECRTSLDEQLDGCDATVGELETCLEHFYAATGALTSGVSCDDVGDEDVIQQLAISLAALEATLPSECGAVLACAPDLAPL